MISHLLVRGLPGGIDPSMADGLLLVVGHARPGTLSPQAQSYKRRGGKKLPEAMHHTHV